MGILSTAGFRLAFSQERSLNQPPAGFVALFNGKDLSGWRGRQPNYDPRAEAALSSEELAVKQAQWNSERDMHWSVDLPKARSSPTAEAPTSQPQRISETSNYMSIG